MKQDKTKRNKTNRNRTKPGPMKHEIYFKFKLLVTLKVGYGVFPACCQSDTIFTATYYRYYHC